MVAVLNWKSVQMFGFKVQTYGQNFWVPPLPPAAAAAASVATLSKLKPCTSPSYTSIKATLTPRLPSMPRGGAKSTATRARSDADAATDVTLHELLQDTVLLAAEEGAAASCATFVEYVCAVLPEEMLQRLAEVMGGGGGREDGDGTSWLLQEIWEERYAPDNTPQDSSDGDDGAPLDCEVCERSVRLTRHHLFPREMHKFCIKRSLASPQELERRVLHCCRLCHSAIHRFFTNEDLALRYNTLQLLLADDKFFRFARWNAAQPAGRNGKCR